MLLAQPLKRLGAAAAVPAEAEVMADDDVFDAYGPNQILVNELLRAEARKACEKRWSTTRCTPCWARESNFSRRLRINGSGRSGRRTESGWG